MESYENFCLARFTQDPKTAGLMAEILEALMRKLRLLSEIHDPKVRNKQMRPLRASIQKKIPKEKPWKAFSYYVHNLCGKHYGRTQAECQIQRDWVRLHRRGEKKEHVRKSKRGVIERRRLTALQRRRNRALLRSFRAQKNSAFLLRIRDELK